MRLSNRKMIVTMLKQRYILALGIIVIMLILSEVMLQRALKFEQDDSRVINIAGRQRMLSQKINKAALGLYFSSDSAQRAMYHYEIYTALSLWQQSHQGLQNGNKSMGLPGDNSSKVQKMFALIEPNYQVMVETAQNILELGPEYSLEKHRQLFAYLQIMQANEGDFLRGMDAIVFQYDQESRDKIGEIRSLECLILLVALITVCLEFIFIFRPTWEQVGLALREVEISRRNLFKIFETAPAAMLFVDIDDCKIVRLNNLAKNLLKNALAASQDMNFAHTLNLSPEQFSQLWEKIIAGEILENVEVELLDKEHRGRVALLSANIISYEEKYGVLIGLVEITPQKEAEEILRKYASIDDMTGLMNKRSGLNFLENALVSRSSEPLSVAFIDVDGLKYVNDTYGHEEGDAYIRQIAKVIRGNLGSHDVVFRYGGDEFVLILDNCAREIAEVVLQRIVQKLERLNAQSTKPYAWHISYGIAEYGEITNEDLKSILARADQEMYLQKRQRKQAQKK